MNSHYILVTLPPHKKQEKATTYWIVPCKIPDSQISTVDLMSLNYNFVDMKKVEDYFLNKHKPSASKIEILAKTPSRAYLRNRWTLSKNDLESKF